jgi:ribonuclease P protein component
VPGALIYDQEEATLKRAQVALIAGKKQFKTSVARHAIKRQWVAKLRPVVAQMKPGRYVYVLRGN